MKRLNDEYFGLVTVCFKLIDEGKCHINVAFQTLKNNEMLLMKLMQQRILVVDDEPDYVEMISWVLEKNGFSVESAHDGLDGLNKARTSQPDLILLDLMLPELDGAEVCDILRHLPSTAGIPVLMLTGCSTEERRLSAVRAGVNDYLIKPCDTPVLLRRIHSMLSERKERDLESLIDGQEN